MKQILTFGILTVLSFGLLGQSYYETQLTNYVRKTYPDSIEHLIRIIQRSNTPSRSLLLYSFPLNSAEAYYLMQIDYREGVEYAGIYFDITNLWFDYCLRKDESFIREYISYSSYVDGYFAEDYYVGLDVLYQKLGSKFCLILKKMPLEDKEKIISPERGFPCGK